MLVTGLAVIRLILAGELVKETYGDFVVRLKIIAEEWEKMCVVDKI